MKSDLDKRRARYFKLSTLISQIDTPRLIVLLKQRNRTLVWGDNQVLQVNGTRVFVKTFPVTEL